MKMILIPVTVCQILAVKVIVLIQIFPRRYCFLNSSKNLSKILKKTFRKSSMFITNRTLLWMFFLGVLQTLLEQLFPIIFLERLLLC